MFTLKLYRNHAGPSDHVVIMETVGVWANRCDGDVREINAFKDTVGKGDYETFYVGGEPTPAQNAIAKGAGGNWYDWAVLENQMGSTTEMFR